MIFAIFDGLLGSVEPTSASETIVFDLITHMDSVLQE